ncbi:hypothetical protein BVG19_g5456 [[Candida] boidinii]|nr:hypothetical protein BVG19_g5456 [[Candida] boidinii]OWB53909.1 hypothetical protein B5S27_g5524 [[Candida] boidinii]
MSNSDYSDIPTSTPEIQNSNVLSDGIRHIGESVHGIGEIVGESVQGFGERVHDFGERVHGIGEIVGERVHHLIVDDEDNTEEIEHFKYKQELQRKMTVPSLIGLGFSLMNVPFGVSSTLSIGLVCGGNVTILWGWVIVSVLNLFIALSLAEITSKYPTSGGVYHFSAILAPEKYSLVSSWFTGWYLILGNLTFFISDVFGGALFVLSIFGLNNSNYKRNDLFVLLLYYLFVIICAIVNIKFQNLLEKINKACTYWVIYTVLIMDFLLLIFPSNFHDIKYVLTHFDASRSGWPGPVAFFIGLQAASFTLQGFGMIPSMCDEVKTPEKTVPKGMVYSVLVTSFTGIIFIIPVLSILPELSRLLDDNPEIFPIDIVFKLSTKSMVVSFLLVIMLCGTLFFAGVSTLTTASRCFYSFARDNGLPFSHFFAHVDETESNEVVPKNTVILSCIISMILALLSLIASSAFNAFMGCAVISLAMANGIPIFFSLLGKRKKVKGSGFKLHKLGYFLNGVSVIWVFITVVVLCMPPSRFISVSTMNYAVVVFVTFSVITTITYFTWGKSHFQGPQLESRELTNNIRFRANSNGATVVNNIKTNNSTLTNSEELGMSSSQASTFQIDDPFADDEEGSNYNDNFGQSPQAKTSKNYTKLNTNESVDNDSFVFDDDITYIDHGADADTSQLPSNINGGSDDQLDLSSQRGKNGKNGKSSKRGSSKAKVRKSSNTQSANQAGETIFERDTL